MFFKKNWSMTDWKLEKQKWEKHSSKGGHLLLLLSRVSVSDSVQPHRWQLTRLPHPWDSPGKNTGVGCYFLLQAWKWKVKVKSLSRVGLSAMPRTAAYQAPPSMGFSKQEYWSGVPLPSPTPEHIAILDHDTSVYKEAWSLVEEVPKERFHYHQYC